MHQNLLKRNDLGNLKLDVDDLDIDKFKIVLVYLSNVSNILKNDVVKKTVYEELAKKVNAIQTIDTCDLVKRLTTTQKL